MRYISVYLILLAGVMALAEESELGERLALVIKRYHVIERNCSAEVGIDDYDDSSSDKEHCKMACVLRKSRILTDEGFSRKAMDRIVSYIFENEPLLKQLSLNVNLVCEKKVAALKATDECDIAWNIHLCLHSNWKRTGYKHYKPKSYN